MNEKPNVLFILVDQLRYDVFSYADNKYIKTPNIDRLAKEGVLFSDAICSAPLCGPSRAAMLSGRYSKGNYEFCNREPEEKSPWLIDLKTYDEILSENGYSCTWHGKWHNGQGHRDCYNEDSFLFGHDCIAYHSYLKNKYDFPNLKRQKIDRYSKWPYQPYDVDDVMSLAKESGFHMPHHNEAGILDIKPEDSLTAWTVKRSVEFLDKILQEPFSLTCSILNPHAPLLTTAQYADMYKDIKFPLPENIDSLARENSPIPRAFAYENLQEFTRLYYALVKELDDWVGELLNALDRNSLTENTLVILTADHGELMGSHGALSKCEFFEECLRVPLLMRFPNRIPAGKINKGGASGVDLAPTILEYCGVLNDNSMDGKSLVSEINSETLHDRYVFSEYNDLICLRSSRWKAVFKKSKCIHLYDLETDKYEKNNLAEKRYNKRLPNSCNASTENSIGCVILERWRLLSGQRIIRHSGMS